MDVVEVLAVLAGLSLVLLGLADVFLTILHPDRDGPASVALNRVTWRTAVAGARLFPHAAGELIALAGATMIAATIVLWIVLQVVGFALLAWPFLDTAFTRPGTDPATLLDALYWSGVTFTTLGYGDITPVAWPWRVVALAEAGIGFALISGAVAFLLEVFQGVDYRDRTALHVYSETRRTWDGVGFVLRIVREQGPQVAAIRLGRWADEVRGLHERLYRFQPLAFYVRTRSAKHQPERMLEALADVTLTAALVSRSELGAPMRPVADELEIVYTEFTHSAIRHHGTGAALRALEHPQPTAEDEARIVRLARRIEDALGAEAAPPPEAARELRVLAAHLRTFLAEIRRITRWDVLRADPHLA